MAEGTVEGKTKLYTDWNKLMRKVDDIPKKSKVAFFIHCTTIKGKRMIISSGRLRGRDTDMPNWAPLAENDDIVGVWFSPSGEELPKKSPYGSQRIKFDVDNLLSYLCSNGNEENKDEFPAEADETTDVPLEQSENDEVYEKRKKEQTSNDESKSDTVWTQEELPLLFFECAYHYGSTQYVRLILIRGTDPNAEWCHRCLKKISISNNPFLLYKKGKMFTYSTCPRYDRRGIHVQVLVVGDIEFEKLRDPPEWDKVGTLQRAGHDPMPGVC